MSKVPVQCIPAGQQLFYFCELFHPCSYSSQLFSILHVCSYSFFFRNLFCIRLLWKGVFLGCASHAGGIWKGDILVADIEEELVEMDASEIHAERPNAKGVLMSMNGEKLILPIADGTVKLSGGNQVLRTSTIIRDSPDRGEEQGDLPGESDGSSSTPLQDSSLYDGEARNDFWSISGNFIYRHHVEPRVKLYVPREESFPIPLKYIDVTRATSTSLMPEKMSTIIRTLMEVEICWIRGQVSQVSLYRMKKHWMDIHGPGGD